MKREPTHADFPPGTRVRLWTPQNNPVLASLGIKDRYVHVNATPYLTGITLPTPAYFRDLIFFQPDGWPVQDPRGFAVSLIRLENWNGESIPCTVTDGICRPVEFKKEV